jgi:hypothetical protein
VVSSAGRWSQLRRRDPGICGETVSGLAELEAVRVKKEKEKENIF